MNFGLISAKSTISSKRSSISFSDMPCNEPTRYTFSRPVRLSLNPARSSRRGATLPCTLTLPSSGRRTPAIILSRVDLPVPFLPTMPTQSPLATSNETSLKGQKSSPSALGSRFLP